MRCNDKFSLFKCITDECPNRGRQWIVEPREVVPGLVAVIDGLRCSGCGCGPNFLARGTITERFGDM